MLELYCEVLGFCCLGLVVGFCALVMCWWWGFFVWLVLYSGLFVLWGFFTKKRQNELFFSPLKGKILL